MTINKTDSTSEFRFLPKDKKKGAKKTEHKSGRIHIGSEGALSLAAKKVDNTKGVLAKFTHFIDIHFRCVQLKFGDQIYNVNINSIARRLHLSQGKVRSAIRKGKMEKIIKNYAKILKEAEFAPIPKETAIKALGVAMSTKQTIRIKDIQYKTPEAYLSKKITLLIGKEGSEYKISRLDKTLGGGAYGTINETVGICDKLGTQIIKTSTYEMEPTSSSHMHSIKSIVNEVEKLRLLNFEGAHRGVQGKAHLVADLNSAKPSRVGMMTAKLSGDYREVCTAPPKGSNYLDEFDQLLDGLAYIHSKEIVHGDIKPANFLYSENEKGKVNVVIADFGGARNASDKSDWKKGITATPAYTIFGENKSQDKEILKKHDVFSMGCSLIQRITGNESPFSVYKQPIPWPDPSHLNPLPDHIHPHLKQLLIEMVNEDPHKRPTAQEARTRLQKIIELETQSGFSKKSDEA